MPQAEIDGACLARLELQIEKNVTRTLMDGEAARREILCAPIILEVAHYANAWVSIEYSVEVNQSLKGTLDFYMRNDRHLLVSKAKNADLMRGFTQLAVEQLVVELAVHELRSGGFAVWVRDDRRYLAVWTARVVEANDRAGYATVPGAC